MFSKMFHSNSVIKTLTSHILLISIKPTYAHLIYITIQVFAYSYMF